jgi:hypothetical protein
MTTTVELYSRLPYRFSLHFTFRENIAAFTELGSGGTCSLRLNFMFSENILACLLSWAHVPHFGFGGIRR